MPGLAGHAVGPRLETADDSHADRLVARLVDDVESGDVVTFNGAVPKLIRSQIWAEAASAIRSRGAVVIADVQGESLRALLRTRVVAMAKPNEDEAQVLAADRQPWEGDTASAAVFAMLDAGVADPIVSVGEHGVIHVQDGFLVRSWCEVVRPKLVVGAGDAFLAGYCAALQGKEWHKVPPVHLGLASASAHIAGAKDQQFSRMAVENLGRVSHERIGRCQTP